MKANYATNAGNATTADSAKYATEASNALHADTATEATHATEADHAQQATESERAINSNYCVLAKQAERLNVGSHQIVILADTHYVIFLTPNKKPEECVMLDLDNRALFNVAQITTPGGQMYGIVSEE
jgi:hypothetical protein